MSSNTKTVILDWVKALNQHDPDAAAEFFDPECSFVNIGTGERLSGRAAVRNDMAGLFTRWSDLQIEIPNIIVSADGQFAAEWVMTGRHTGDTPACPATGRSFCLLGVGVGQVRNQQIVNVIEYWNLADFLSQVGALPQS